MNIPGKWVMISRLKETLYFISFVFLLSLRKFFNVVMISSCKQDLAAIRPRNMLQPMPGTNKRCCRIWTLFPLNIRYLVFPTMCVFLVLGIHLSERMTMARVSLSAGSNFTDLWWARRLWFDQVPLRIIGIHLRSYNNPGLCSYRPHGIKNGLPRRYCLKKKTQAISIYFRSFYKLFSINLILRAPATDRVPVSSFFLSFLFFTHILIKLSCTRSWYCSCFASLSAKLPSIYQTQQYQLML